MCAKKKNYIFMLILVEFSSLKIELKEMIRSSYGDVIHVISHTNVKFLSKEMFCLLVRTCTHTHTHTLARACV